MSRRKGTGAANRHWLAGFLGTQAVLRWHERTVTQRPLRRALPVLNLYPPPVVAQVPEHAPDDDVPPSRVIYGENGQPVSIGGKTVEQIKTEVTLQRIRSEAALAAPTRMPRKPSPVKPERSQIGYAPEGDTNQLDLVNSRARIIGIGAAKNAAIEAHYAREWARQRDFDNHVRPIRDAIAWCEAEITRLAQSRDGDRPPGNWMRMGIQPQEMPPGMRQDIPPEWDIDVSHGLSPSKQSKNRVGKIAKLKREVEQLRQMLVEAGPRPKMKHAPSDTVGIEMQDDGEVLVKLQA